MPEVNGGDEFYVGYQPKAPPRLARMLRLILAALLAGGVAIAVVLVWGQAAFAPSRFEFQQYRSYRGMLVERPYPMLLTSEHQYLLAGEGKHGVTAEARGLEGQSVNLQGALIEYGPNRMLELLAGSLHPDPAAGSAKAETTSLGRVVLTGEIVDTKCHFGVMNPGRGKVHRDCAARCISGGVPPGFLARGGGGVYLLAGADGRPLGREVLDYVAEPLTISGELSKIGSILILKTEPRDFRRE